MKMTTKVQRRHTRWVVALAIGHVLARMGAQIILSPSAWAVEADFDHARRPYGAEWRQAYTTLSALYDIAVIGVSGVGWIPAGPWAGRKLIGCSLAVGPGGAILIEGPYGEAAEVVVTVDVTLQPALARGTGFADVLRERGYRGP